MALVSNNDLNIILAKYAGVSEAEASKFLEAFTSVIASHVKEGEEVEVQGLGVFKVIETNQAELRHVSLILSDSMKEAVNAPFAFFEPFVITPAAENLAEEPVEFVAEETAEVIAEEPAEDIPEETTEDIAEESAEVIAEEPAEVIAEEPAEDISEEPAEVIAAEPIEEKQEEPETKPDPKTEPKKEVKKDYGEGKVFFITVLVVLLLFLGGGYCYINRKSIGNYIEMHLHTKKKPIKPKHDTVVLPDSLKANADSLRADSLRTDSIKAAIADSIRLDSIKAAIEKQKPLIPEERRNKRMIDQYGDLVTVVVQPGEFLTIIALNNFGHKDFWPYVFEVNSDKLAKPSDVRRGMMLFLPDPEFFGIHEDDEASLRRARNRGAQILKKLTEQE